MGQGQVKPVEAKVEAISDFPVNTFQFDLTISMWSSCKILIQKRLYRFYILDLTNTC